MQAVETSEKPIFT